MSENPRSYLVCEGFQFDGVSELFVGDIEPSQPVGLVFAGPEGSVMLPQASTFPDARQSLSFFLPQHPNRPEGMRSVDWF